MWTSRFYYILENTFYAFFNLKTLAWRWGETKWSYSAQFYLTQLEETPSENGWSWFAFTEESLVTSILDIWLNLNIIWVHIEKIFKKNSPPMFFFVSMKFYHLTPYEYEWTFWKFKQRWKRMINAHIGVPDVLFFFQFSAAFGTTFICRWNVDFYTLNQK